MKSNMHDFSRFKHLDIRDGKSRVYRICDTRTNSVLYIGCTNVSVYCRLVWHINDAESLSSDKKKGILIGKALETNSLSVEVLYEFSDRQVAEIVEKHLINYISNNHNKVHDLFNTIATKDVSEKVFYKNINLKNGRN